MLLFNHQASCHRYFLSIFSFSFFPGGCDEFIFAIIRFLLSRDMNVVGCENFFVDSNFHRIALARIGAGDVNTVETGYKIYRLRV